MQNILATKTRDITVKETALQELSESLALSVCLYTSSIIVESVISYIIDSHQSGVNRGEKSLCKKKARFNSSRYFARIPNIITSKEQSSGLIDGYSEQNVNCSYDFVLHLNCIVMFINYLFIYS